MIKFYVKLKSGDKITIETSDEKISNYFKEKEVENEK